MANTNINTNLSLDLKGFKELVEINSLFENLKKTIESLTLGFENFNKNFISKAIDYESSIADIKQVLNLGSNKELQKFSDDILKLTQTIPLKASNIANIAVSLGRENIPQNELLDYTKLVAKMQLAFDVDPSEVVKSISYMKNSLKLNTKDIEDIFNLQGVLDKEFSKSMQMTKNSLVILNNSFDGIKIDIGTKFLPITQGISSLVQSFTNIINSSEVLKGVLLTLVAGFSLLKVAFDLTNSYFAFVDFLKKFKELTIVQALYNGLVSIGTFLKQRYIATVGLLSGTFNFLKASIFTTTTALSILKFALISTGIGAIIVGIGLAANYLIENWSSVKEFFSNFWQGIKESWLSISNFFSTLFTPVIEAWNNLFSGWFSWIYEKLSGLLNLFNFSKIGEKLSNSFGNITSSIGDFLGFNNEISAKNISKNINNNNTLSMLNPINSQKTTAMAMPIGGNSPINITFSGDFSLFSSNGQFDFESFKQQITKSVKDAISKEQFNKANTSIKG